MNVNNCLPSEVASVSFSPLSSADIRRLSVLQVVNPQHFDSLNQPNPKGLYDEHMGPSSRGNTCLTCQQGSAFCPGHFGHIELPRPVFHPLFMNHLYILIRSACLYCHHFKASAYDSIKLAGKLTLLDHGLVAEADALDALMARHVPQSKAKSKKGKSNKSGDAMDEDAAAVGAAAEPDEEADANGMNPQDFQEFVDEQIRSMLAHAEQDLGRPLSRDGYKNGPASDERRQLVAQYQKLCVNKRRCEVCGAVANRYRKEQYLRFMELSLTAKQAMHNKAIEAHRPSKQLLKQKLLRTTAQRELQSKRQRGAGAETEDSSMADAEEDRMRQQARREASESLADSDEEGPGDDLMEIDEPQHQQQEKQKAQDAQNAKKAKSTKQTESILHTDEVQLHISILFNVQAKLVDLMYGPHGPMSLAPANLPARLLSSSSAASPPADANMFFMDVIAVPPSRFRPASIMGEMTFENPQTELLGKVLATTIRIRDRNAELRILTDKKSQLENGAVQALAADMDPVRVYEQLLIALDELQNNVNGLIDAGKNSAAPRGREPTPGVKQVLEKKEGLFRMNMMGKRVNYAARSVISPDVNIETNEIGVPPVFAKKLTFPEPINQYNVQAMQRAVINGPFVHPGAVSVEDEDGHITLLSKKTEEERKGIANLLMTTKTTPVGARPDVGLPPTRTSQIPKKVHRHLRDGDIVILNRQPTLHKPSMMCHKVKILKGEKTIRMHYANCNSYNADFDGDEMNMHFPQSLVAQAEARMIANTDNQYLVPTSGNPLRGLIQDHVVAGVWMTKRDSFFTRAEYQQLLYGALRPEENYTGGGRVITLPPAIMRPKPLWTGKQIISTIMKNVCPEHLLGLSMLGKSKTPGSQWGPGSVEGNVIFQDGELLCGILDKAQFGASSYGMVHSVHELYGPEVTGKLLGILSRLFTKFLQHDAFSCGMEDLHLTDKSNSERHELLQSADQQGMKAALGFTNLSDVDPSRPDVMHNLNTRLEEVLRDDSKLALLDRAMMAQAGEINSSVIKNCLPSGLSKPFPRNGMATMTVSGAKGSNVNFSQISCLLGQQALEGRRVPNMVSGKTLPSFKPFETALRAGGFVAQRFLTGIRPQEYYFHCMAGREGLIDTAVKTSRSGYLQRCLIKHLEGISVQYDYTVRNSDGGVIQFNYGEDSLDVTRQKHLKQLEFVTRNWRTLAQRYDAGALAERIDNEVAGEHMRKTLKKLAKGSHHVHAPYTTLSQYNPGSHLGSVSEDYAKAVSQYLDTNPHGLIKPKKKKFQEWPEWQKKGVVINYEQFKNLMSTRYIQALVDPGEAVGLLASQGVGEPSTQMTLNTFHLAGHGAANVTLGIPRLREIVMTASASIATPTMKIPFLSDKSEAEQRRFVQKSSKLTIAEIIDQVSVEERLLPKTEGPRKRKYDVTLQFYDPAEYTQTYGVEVEEVLHGIVTNFMPLLEKAIKDELKRSKKQEKAQADDIGRGHAARMAEAQTEEEGQEDEILRHDNIEDMEDGDADDLKRAEQQNQNHDYDAEDDGADGTGKADPEDEFEAAFGADDTDNRNKTRDGDASGSDSEDEDAAAGASKSSRSSHEKSKERLEKLEAQGVSSSKFVGSFKFDKERGAWCKFDLQLTSRAVKLLLVGIIEKICQKSVVRQQPGISRAIFTPADKMDPKTYCTTEGCNLKGVWNWAWLDGKPFLDLDQVYTNDIAATLRTYGVEAARAALITEVSAVFGVYGIDVNRRHLSLIADYMTSEGGYKPFNRTGLSNNTSPFLKASFETTGTFITDAALYGDFDTMRNPSSNIVLGKIPLSGTGVFDVAVPESSRDFE